MKKRILIVEDCKEDIIALNSLFATTYDLDFATHLALARNKLSSSSYDLVLLDLGLPDGMGLNLLSDFAEQFKANKTRVFVLSGFKEESEKLHAFQLDADEYLTKPVPLKELKARVDSSFRKRASGEETSGTKSLGNLTIDIHAQKVKIQKDTMEYEVLNLTPTEFRLLVFFVESREQVRSRIQIIDSVWGDSVNVIDRAVDTHICNLRKKLIESDYNIETILHTGYALKKQ